LAAPASELRLRVAAVLPYQGRIVLVRHRKDDAVYHLLPGGGVEVGESVGDALAREVREETGLIARAVRPLFVSDSIAPDGSRHMVQLTFLGEVTGGELTAGPADARVEAVDLAVPDELGAYDLRPPMGEALRLAAESGFLGEARYLGSLWSDGHGVNGTGEAPATDG
jgi:8-oxo-dGTP diphosphatase